LNKSRARKRGTEKKENWSKVDRPIKRNAFVWGANRRLDLSGTMSANQPDTKLREN